MTLSQGKEYLTQTLKPMVPSDSLDMIIEYLSSYEPNQNNVDEMRRFLEDVCLKREAGLNDIILRYIEVCRQQDTNNSTTFIPKHFTQQGQNKNEKKHSHSNEQRHLNQERKQKQTSSSPSQPTPPQPQPQPQQQHHANQQQSNKKKTPPPNPNQSITFVAEKKNEAPNQKKTSGVQNNNLKKKKSNSSEKSTDRHICACFATHHEYYTSCLYCGRIHCSLEGPGTCIYCGADLVPPLSADVVCEVLCEHGVDEVVYGAYLQKDKLLKFDKEHAKRTQVHDAQGDYYETGTWLTQEEKDQIAEKEKKRLEKYHARGRQPTKVSFDLAGRKIYESTEDEIDCCRDHKDQDVDQHHQPSTNMSSSSSSSSSHQLSFDLSAMSLENVSLAHMSSKHAVMYRTLRERLLADSSLPSNDEKENDKSCSLLLGPVGVSTVDSLHKLKIQHSLEG